MQLKLIKYPRLGLNCLVMMTSGGTFKLSAIGDVIDVPEGAGYEIMAKYPECVEHVVTQPKASRKPKVEGRMITSPENKANQMLQEF